jgi:hypothetical protein
MEEYMAEVRMTPLGVRQHAVLTRIIVNHAYSPEDRQEVNDLVRHRDIVIEGNDSTRIVPDH